MSFAPCGFEIERDSRDQRPAQYQIDLAKNEVRSVELGQNPILLRVRSGLCWITIEGDQTDYAAVEGDALSFAGPGLLVIQALSADGSVEMIPLE